MLHGFYWRLVLWVRPTISRSPELFDLASAQLAWRGSLPGLRVKDVLDGVLRRGLEGAHRGQGVRLDHAPHVRLGRQLQGCQSDM